MNPNVENILTEVYRNHPFGRDKLYKIVNEDHPEISRRTVMEFLRNLEVHQMHSPNKKYTNSTTTTIVSKPRFKFHADLVYMDKLAGYNDGCFYWLTVVDNFSHYSFIRLLRGRTSKEVAENMEDIIKKVAESGEQMTLLQTDNGSEFLAEFELMLKKYNIKHIFSNPHSPWTNSPVEIFNKNIKTYVFRWMTMNKKLRYIENIDELLNNYNDSICSTHNHKPSDVFFERIDLEPIIEKKIQRIHH